MIQTVEIRETSQLSPNISTETFAHQGKKDQPPLIWNTVGPSRGNVLV